MLPAALAAQTPVAPPEQHQYFLGEVRMTTPAGQPIGTSLSLVRRTLQPAERRIIEIVATIDGDKPVREITTLMDVDGSTFAMRYEDRTFSGTGMLIGTPWSWTGWSYEAELTGPRKGRISGQDTLGAGGLTVKKTFATPDGTVRAVFDEELKPISRAAYEILRGRLVR